MFSLFKANIPSPKGTGNIVTEPPENTVNEPTLYTHIGGSGKDITNTK